MNLVQRIKFKLFRLFLSESILGGLTVLLPLAIMLFFFSWLIQTIGEWISPLAHLFDGYGIPLIVSDIVVILLIIVTCSIVGHFVRTRFGNWLHKTLETHLLKILPGYRSLKEIVEMILRKDAAPSKGEVARVWLYGKATPTWTIALITSRHADGSYTAFVPTAPSPASGVIYHLPSHQVELHPEISMDQAFKVIVACGAGASSLFKSSPPSTISSSS